MIKRLSSSIFSSRLFNFLFAQELTQMQMKTIHDFKVKTITENEAKRNLHAEKVAAIGIVSEAIQINKVAGQVKEDDMVKDKVRFQKKYGEAV